LSQQIHPIVSRLCEPIEGIDSMHIASCLGLDPLNFKNKSSSTTSALQINPTLTKQQQKLQAYINEAEKYKNCIPFKFQCPACKTENIWKEAFFKNEVLIIINSYNNLYLC
jgi:DNA polymerase alpha subunit A